MGAFHEEVSIANDGLTTRVSSTIDDHILADDVVVAYDALRLFTFEVEVLRQSSDDRPLVNLVMTAHARTIED